VVMDLMTRQQARARQRADLSQPENTFVRHC
jgi:hypothetical protein